PAAQGSQPEVNEAAPGAEVAAKPTAPEGGDDQEGGEDQQADVAERWIEDSANGYDQYYYAQIGCYPANFGHGMIGSRFIYLDISPSRIMFMTLLNFRAWHQPAFSNIDMKQTPISFLYLILARKSAISSAFTPILGMAMPPRITTTSASKLHFSPSSIPHSVATSRRAFSLSRPGIKASSFSRTG